MAFSTDNIGKNCYINISEDENIEDSLYGTIIGYYKNTDKNEEYYFVSINGEVKRIYDDNLVNIVDDGGSVTPGTLIMVSGEMTESQATQFRENIGAVSIDDIGTVFVLKGSVDTVADLPISGNHVGDVYYVQDVSAGYIWLISDSQPNGYWEELGETFNVTIDSKLSNTSENPVQNKVINAALATKGTYSKPSSGIPKSDLSSAVQTSLGKADTALQAAPVTSVNGKTGAVVLNAEDVGGFVTPESIVAATGQMGGGQKSETRDNLGAISTADMENMKIEIAEAVARIIVLMAVNSGNLVLDLKSWGGIKGFSNAYVAGLNAVFALPMLYLDQTAAGNDVLAMQLVGSDTENGVFHFESVRGGKRYYARMAPISENVLSGPLVIRDELPQVTTADNGSILQVANGSWTSATLPSTESLKLTATPTAGPSGDTLMSGTWSGATWQQVVTAIQASRLIQVDVATIGKITLLYNLGSATNASSNAFVYAVGGTLYNVFAELIVVGGNNEFHLSIINARTETVNIIGTTPTIEPKANKIYQCGELTSLKIINPPATGKYSIIFFSGATATTTVGIENFVAEANKRYKITVEDNYATYDSWPYTQA